MIDYAVVIADLTEKHEAIGQVLTGFQRLAGAVPGTAAPIAPSHRIPTPPRRVATKHARPSPRKPPKKRLKPARVKAASAPAAKHARRAVAAEVLARAKAIAAREGLPAAAQATGISYQTLWGRASREHWPLPKVKGTRRPAAIGKPTAKPVSSVPREGTPTPLRVCAQCERRVTLDPCPHCGTAWHRSAT